MIYVVEELAHFALDKLRSQKTSSVSPKNEDKSNEHQHGDHVHEEIPTDLFANLDKGTFQVNIQLGVFLPMPVLTNCLIWQVAFRGFFIILAISLHAVFEGMAMGLSKKASFIWYLCFAIACHKFIIAFCVGLQV